MDTLQRNGYDLAKAMSTLVPQGGPVLCRDEMEEWSASEAMLFEEALEKYGKDFNDIRQDFVSGDGGRDPPGTSSKSLLCGGCKNLPGTRTGLLHLGGDMNPGEGLGALEIDPALARVCGGCCGTAVCLPPTPCLQGLGVWGFPGAV